MHGRRCARRHKPGEFMHDEKSGSNMHYIARHVNGPTGQLGIAHNGMRVRHINLSSPSHRAALLAPLAKEAGGFGICPEVVFKDTKDPDYQRMLKALAAPNKYLKTAKLYNMPGFKPNKHYVREMKRYGVLPATFDVEKDPIDVFATDQAYWRTMWHQPAEHAR